MKPLVNYCRWRRARLRLHGRSEDEVWGQLVFRAAGDEDEVKPFRYHLADAELIIEEDGNERHIRLDEVGVPIAD
jgi:hypothetical protein